MSMSLNSGTCVHVPLHLQSHQLALGEGRLGGAETCAESPAALGVVLGPEVAVVEGEQLARRGSEVPPEEGEGVEDVGSEDAEMIEAARRREGALLERLDLRRVRFGRRGPVSARDTRARDLAEFSRSEDEVDVLEEREGLDASEPVQGRRRNREALVAPGELQGRGPQVGPEPTTEGDSGTAPRPRRRRETRRDRSCDSIAASHDLRDRRPSSSWNAKAHMAHSEPNASRRRASYPGGGSVSAWRKKRASPVAAATPAAIAGPLPARDVDVARTRDAAASSSRDAATFLATATVPSVDPASTTTISTGPTA